MAPKKITVEGVGGVILSSDASLEKWLGKKGRECLLKEEAEIVDFESLEDGGTYTFGPRVIQQQQQQQQQPNDPAPRLTSPQEKFRQLLQKSSVTPTESVMRVILKHFASSVALVDSPEQASELYFDAALIPRSATKVVLQVSGISVAGVFSGSDPSKAVLLHAHEHGAPRILKIATDKSIRHEWGVFSAVASLNRPDEDAETFLVPVKLLEFESAEIELGDFSGGDSLHPTPRCGLLMKHFQGTLAQCKIPLTTEVLLRYGTNLQTALSALHQAGFCHLDVKPANVFLFEGSCYLGDYGAAVKTGDPIRERTVKYYPRDGPFDASEQTDMYLLAVTMLEMFGTIPSSSERESMTEREIRDTIDSVETIEVQNFLQSLFRD